MRAVLQRVSRAKVTVDGQICGEIAQGLLILVCAMQGDTQQQADQLADKIIKLRIFRDEASKMNKSLRDVGGAALIVSQFTLAADLRGNRPGFSTAAAPEQGKMLYEYFVQRIRAADIPAQTGIFGADMAVELVNDGPVTIWMDSAA